MPWWTTCNTQYREYNLPDDAEARWQEIKRLLARFTPTLPKTEETIKQVTWHLDHEPCKKSSLRPLSNLLYGGVILGPDDKIHLHAPTAVGSGGKWTISPKPKQRGLDVVVDGGIEEDVTDDVDGEEGFNGLPDDEVMDGEDDKEDDQGEGDSEDEVEEDVEEKGENGGEGGGDEIQESAHTDPETLEMRRDLDPRQLYVKVIYDFDGIGELNEATGSTKPEEVLHVSRQRTLPELFTFLEVFVERMLETTEMKCYLKTPQGSTLLLRPQLKHDCPVKRRAFSFDDTGIPRVAVINDLLDDGTTFFSTSMPTKDKTGTESDYQPQLTVVLKYVDAIERNAAADPLVIIRSGAETSRNGELAEFFRIGTKPVKEGDEKHAVAVSNTYFWRCKSEGDTRAVNLVKTPTWSLRGLTICNPDESNSMAQKSITFERREDAAVPTRQDQFLGHLKKGRLHAYTQGRLLYNYESWLRDAALSHQVQPIESMEFPESGITVAVRYINHLQDDAVKDFIFGPGDEFELEENDDHKALCGLVRETLQREKPLEDFDGDWDLELWIMPQIPDGRSLFKFKRTSKLTDWLHKPCVDLGDAVLFAEAHIIPVAAEKKVSSNGRAAKKARRA